MTARLVGVAFGLTLAICTNLGSAWAQETIDTAQLEAASPDVVYKPPDAPGYVVPTGDTQDVRPGDGITVSAGGRAALQFRDSLRVQIFHDSEIHIESSLQPDPDTPLIYYFSMLAGTIFSDGSAATIAKRRVVISTPNGVTIQPEGTQFLVYYDPSTQTSWVVVTEGLVRVTASGIDLDVPAGFQTWIEQDQPPEPLMASERAAIGDRFPSIDDLTGGTLAEADLLPVASEPVSAAPAPEAAAPAPEAAAPAAAPPPPAPAAAPPAPAPAAASPAPAPAAAPPAPAAASPTPAPAAAPPAHGGDTQLCGHKDQDEDEDAPSPCHPRAHCGSQHRSDATEEVRGKQRPTRPIEQHGRKTRDCASTP